MQTILSFSTFALVIVTLLVGTMKLQRAASPSTAEFMLVSARDIISGPISTSRNDVGIGVVHRDGNDFSMLIDDLNVDEFRAKWSPDLRYVYFVSGDTVRRYDRLGRRTITLIDGVTPIGPLHVSPDGEWIAFVDKPSGRSFLRAVRQDGTEQRPLTDIGLHVHAGAWSTNGEQLLYVHYEGNLEYIYEFDLQTNTLSYLREGYSPIYSSNGQAIVFLLDGDNTTLIAHVPREAPQTEPHILYENPHIEQPIVLSADGQRIAFAVEGSIVQMRIDGSGGPEVFLARNNQHRFADPAWSRVLDMDENLWLTFTAAVLVLCATIMGSVGWGYLSPSASFSRK